MPGNSVRGWSDIDSFLKFPVALATIAGTLIAGLVFYYTRTKDKAEEEKAKTYGACSLKPVTPANVTRLNKYIAEGEYYKSLGKYNLASHSFEQVINEDPKYLGANEDLGVVEMAEGDLKKGQESFDAELRAIDCLRSVPKGELGRFAYWLTSDKSASADDSTARQRLDQAEDAVHYNMACAYSKQNEQVAALDELRKASEHHSIHRSTIIQDPDLTSVRHHAGFEAALALFR